VWPEANTQGAWDVGLRPAPGGPQAALRAARAAYLLACDPAREDPAAAASLAALDLLVVQDLFLTESAKRADVVLPAQAFVEREGSYTSGERRVQRFYPAVPALPGTLPDWQILANVGQRLGLGTAWSTAAQVMEALAASVADYAEVSYGALGEVKRQWPVVGGRDLYYGGTAYCNHQGTGVHLRSALERGEAFEIRLIRPPETPTDSGLLLIPVVHLYEPEATLARTEILGGHFADPVLLLAPETANRLGLRQGQVLEVSANGRTARLSLRVDEGVPAEVGLVPRRCGLGLQEPAVAELRAVERVEV